MPNPSDKGPTTAINFTYLRACACYGLAWLCWQGYLAGTPWLALFAAMFAVGVLIHGSVAIFKTIKVIMGTLRWARFRKGHAAPKADPMAKAEELRAKGILK